MTCRLLFTQQQVSIDQACYVLIFDDSITSVQEQMLLDEQHLFNADVISSCDPVQVHA